jgi:GntP family gluconate:H+ symporter
MALNSDLAFHPVYLGLAIGCGSKLVPWMNDSGFWIICKLSNLTEKEALKPYLPLLVVMGFTGLISHYDRS